MMPAENSSLPQAKEIRLCNHTLEHPADFYHLLASWAELAPDAIAIAAPGRAPLTYSRLLSHVDDVVKMLNVMGVGRNDRVAMVLPNGPEMAAAFIAVAAGATCAPLNPAYRESEFDFYISDLKAKALVVQSGEDSPAIAVAQKRSIPIIELSPAVETDAGIFSLKGERQQALSPEGFAQAEDVALILYTSGTTSRPKMVPLTHSNLLASARNIKATLQLTEKDRCLNVMPLFHIHGLIGAILSSVMAGASIVCASDFDSEKFFAWIQQFRPTWYTAVPTMHQTILQRSDRHRDVIARCPLRFIRSSSAALPPRVLQELEEAFHVPVIEAYGMTEASHQIASNPLPPGTRKARSVGLPTGVEVAVIDDQGNVLSSGEAGEILIRGTNIMLAHANSLRANKESFRDGWFRTGDQGYLDRDGYLFITGRLNETINRGGEKISPREVDEVLMEHPAVAEAVTFPVPHTRLGDDIAAAIILRDGFSLTAKQLREFAATRLAPFKVPSRVIFTDAIPKSGTGKPRRADLAGHFDVINRRQKSFVAARSPIETLLAGIWAEVLKLEKVGVHDNFFDLGGHSLLATQVISRVREALQVELPLHTLFENPTVADLAIQIANTQGGTVVPAPGEQAILRLVNRDSVSASFGQQRLWFLQQLEPSSSAYNTLVAFHLEGPLHLAVLKQSLNEIVRRHEVLRTTFSVVDGQPVQVIAPTLTLGLPVVDLRGLLKPEQQAEVNRLSTEEARRPFDLTEGPLLRASVLRLAEEEHILFLTIHHIVSDGWSMGVLFRELSVLYDAFCAGKPSPLPDLPIQYTDFAVWQRQWLQGKVLDSQLVYWKKQLAGTSVLELPTDHPRPPVQTHRGAHQSLVLTKSLADALKRLSRQEGVTLFMILLAAFKTLLYRYTGQEDIVVGSPIANRTRADIEGLIGFFVNTLVLRTDLSGNPSFRELLARVRKVAMAAYDHQDLPFEKLVEELQPERHLSRNPLFQVMFVLQNAPRSVLDLSGLTVNPFEFDSGNTRFDLAVHLWDRADGITSMFIYNTDLFESTTIARMHRHFQTLLEGIVADPEQRLSDLPLLHEAERHQLLVEWNDTERDYPRDRCIHELFEAQVERSPDAVAVVFEDKQLTYRELNHRANQVAHYLRSLGVGPEVLVGICMERSIEMMIGLLGILKAGGAYVPLDPNYPKEQLAFMLEDSQAQVLLTQSNILERLPRAIILNVKSQLQIPKMVCLDTDGHMISRQSEENPISGVAPDNLAYVVYTSGTTGWPKGSMIEHGSVVNYLWWVNESLLGDTVQIVPAVAKPAFDASLKQLFAPLLRGREVWILPEDTVMQPAALLRAIDTRTKVGLNCVPSLWTAVVDAIECGQATTPTESLTGLLIGGEQLTKELVSRSFDALPHLRMWNLYGPTEATANASAAGIVSDEDVTIGRPVANARIYILDGYLNPTPIGVPGELHISGRGLARGYLNRPQMTAEKFIPDPFTTEAGARMYKSGDLARYLPDGSIEFLGRIDYQVKIRGFRIELGEIEAVLSQHPAVQQTVVLAREDIPKDKRLVAYVLPKQEFVPTAGELRSFLKSRLPDYMIPSAFVFLDALPLTPNGKVNLRALPAPDQTRPELTVSFIAPRTQVEEVLAGIWAEVLELEKVGVHDNFFELGGHSLKATQVISRVCKTFQIELPLRSIFEAPTIAGLAERVEAGLRAEQGVQVVPPLQPVSRGRDFPLSFSQQRLWFLDQLQPGSIAYNMSRAVRLTGLLNVAALEQSLDAIVRRHEALRTTFQHSDGLALQVIAPAVTLTLPVVDLQGLPDCEREPEARRLANEEAQRPFDLAKGPLFRAILLRLGEEHHVFVYSMHHIVSDGWSMGVFLRELAALYEAFSTNHPSPLPELPIQYADFTLWQRNWLQEEVLEKELSYWKQQLDGAPVFELPTDHPRPSVQTFCGSKQSLELSKSLTEKLKALSCQEGATLFMTLLAAFKTLLCRYTGQEDIVVGSPIAGRNRAEVEGLIGFFLNTLALRTDLSGNPTFRELLARVREGALGAYAHQNLPFEKLLEELQPQRNLSRTPLFQVFFNMVDLGDDRTLNLPGVIAEPLEFHEPTSRFDLTLYAGDSNGTLRFSLVFNCDLFEPATIVRMLGHFQTLLEGIVANPDRRLSDLPILTEAERRQLLVEWNDTRADYPKDKCIHQLFEAQVERSPDAVAVVFEDTQLSYRELNRRADQLAHYLKKLGVGAEVLVGIHMERSLEMVVGVLGILKAGGAYVPLDPEYPRARLAHMLEDTRLSLLLTQQRLLEGLPPYAREVLCLDRDRRLFEGEAETNPEAVTRPEQLAYVVYTSGSTGKPKGVLTCHRGVVNYLCYLHKTYGLNSADTILQIPSLSFDASVRDLIGPLTAGARVVIVNNFDAKEPSTLLCKIKEHGVTCILSLVPTLLNSLVEVDRSSRRVYDSVRLILVSGEPLTMGSCQKAKEVFGQGTLIVNQYGPTECTMTSTYHPVFEAKDNRDLAPLGRPIPNARLYILDSHLNLVPIGIPGEIHIGGIGLARGYMNSPELTAERFIPDPFSGEPGARLYKTGDLARYMPDGNIEFLGRMDHQVKIRGFRIELGEIEAVLSQHPAVRQAVVLAREDIREEKKLVAYVIPSQESPLTINDLRDFLRQKLPEYMVPSAFVVLDAFPLMPNHKVDRRALPAPDQSRPDLKESFVASRTPAEEVIAGIWAEVLKLERVGIHDNFFDLGGHSLLATQVISRVREAFQVELPLRALFENPTVASLAVQVAQTQAKEAVPEEMTEMLADIESLSDEEVEHLLTQESKGI